MIPTKRDLITAWKIISDLPALRALVEERTVGWCSLVPNLACHPERNEVEGPAVRFFAASGSPIVCLRRCGDHHGIA